MTQKKSSFFSVWLEIFLILVWEIASVGLVTGGAILGLTSNSFWWVFCPIGLLTFSLGLAKMYAD